MKKKTKTQEINLEIINLEINTKTSFLFWEVVGDQPDQMPFPQRVFSSQTTGETEVQCTICYQQGPSTSIQLCQDENNR